MSWYDFIRKEGRQRVDETDDDELNTGDTNKKYKLDMFYSTLAMLVVCMVFLIYNLVYLNQIGNNIEYVNYVSDKYDETFKNKDIVMIIDERLATVDAIIDDVMYTSLGEIDITNTDNAIKNSRNKSVLIFEDIRGRWRFSSELNEINNNCRKYRFRYLKSADEIENNDIIISGYDNIEYKQYVIDMIKLDGVKKELQKRFSDILIMVGMLIILVINIKLLSDKINENTELPLAGLDEDIINTLNEMKIAEKAKGLAEGIKKNVKDIKERNTR